MSTDLQKFDELQAAIELAEPSERIDIDDRLSVIQKIAKKIRADLNKQNIIATARIDNLRKLGDQLDEAREAGFISRGGDHANTIQSLLGKDWISGQIITYADELNDWPEKEYEKWKKSHCANGNATKEITVKGAYGEAKNYRLDKQRREAEVISIEHPDVLLFNAPFQDVLPKLDPEIGSMIFTDPPYAREFLHLYNDLATLCPRVIPEGASVMTYFGHYATDEIMRRMVNEKLKFWWLIAINQPGERRRLDGSGVYVHWKPIAWFVKGGRGNNELVDDLITRSKPEKAKHAWEQSIVEASYYIQKLTEPDDWVIDPMMGYGTTGIAALNNKRRFIGIEIDKTKYLQASERIQKWLGMTTLKNDMN